MKAKYTIMSYIGLLTSLLSFCSCDAHDDHEPLIDTSMHVGDVVCSDGSVLRYADYQKKGNVACAVVFYVNPSTSSGQAQGEGRGYAVCLNDINSVAFTDSIGVSQGTSTSITDYDGNRNTYAIFNNSRIFSPMANAVSEYLVYGQSAYIPSVAQMRLLYVMKDVINPVLKDCGGTELPDNPEVWYWTSTEVKGQSEYKAWLYSMASGAMLETNKLQQHRVRPIITIW